MLVDAIASKKSKKLNNGEIRGLRLFPCARLVRSGRLSSPWWKCTYKCTDIQMDSQPRTAFYMFWYLICVKYSERIFLIYSLLCVFAILRDILGGKECSWRRKTCAWVNPRGFVCAPSLIPSTCHLNALTMCFKVKMLHWKNRLIHVVFHAPSEESWMQWQCVPRNGFWQTSWSLQPPQRKS